MGVYTRLQYKIDFLPGDEVTKIWKRAGRNTKWTQFPAQPMPIPSHPVLGGEEQSDRGPDPSSVGSSPQPLTLSNGPASHLLGLPPVAASLGKYDSLGSSLLLSLQPSGTHLWIPLPSPCPTPPQSSVSSVEALVRDGRNRIGPFPVGSRLYLLQFLHIPFENVSQLLKYLCS